LTISPEAAKGSRYKAILERARTREFWEAMRPFLADAAYVNYLGEVDEEGIRAAYGKKYERLAGADYFRMADNPTGALHFASQNPALVSGPKYGACRR
jgi:hypothetical protein